MRSLPIGMFDSGVGGLTVLRALQRKMPHENTVYLGDTARVPYGTKDCQTIERYALEGAGFLMRRNVKMIIIACNTASAVAQDVIKRKFNIPVLSVITPSVRAAARYTKTGRIGVIATEATIENGAYERGLREACDGKLVEVISQACPLFVPLVEEGETDTPIAHLAAEQYLETVIEGRVDTLILGCTHYPLLANLIGGVIGPGVRLIDPANEVVDAAFQLLLNAGLLNRPDGNVERRFYVTDAARRFHRIAERFLGYSLEHLETTDL